MITEDIELKIGGSGKKFPPIPAGMYTVQISDVNAEDSSFNPGEKVLNWEFTVLDHNEYKVKEENEKEIIVLTRGRRLWKKTSLKITDGVNSKKASWLYKLLIAVDREPAPIEDYKKVPAVDLVNSTLGKQLNVMVNITPGKDNNQYNNILDFLPVQKELDPFEVSVKEDVVTDDLPF